MSLCYAAFHALKKKPLTYKGEDVSTIYGFLNSVLDLYEMFKNDHSCDDLDASEFVFIWDSKTNFRKSIYFEEYKVKRDDKRKEMTPEEKEALLDMYEQADLLRTEILPDLGFKNIFIQEGMEGDDIIGSIVLDDEYLYEKFIMVTGDKDMYQLLSPNCSFYNSRKGLYTYKKFREEWNIVPEQWIDVKAIGGCESDCVPGVPGVKEKTVCKYLNGELKKHHKTYQAITSEYGRAVANFNRVLVELPFPDTDFFDITSSTLIADEFWDLFEYYGFKSFLKERDDEWEEFIKSSHLPF
jgi:DNA polymerase-1